MKYREIRKMIGDMEYVSEFINKKVATSMKGDPKIDMLVPLMNHELIKIKEIIRKIEKEVRKRNILDDYVDIDDYDIPHLEPSMEQFMKDSVKKNQMFREIVEKLGDKINRY